MNVLAYNLLLLLAYPYFAAWLVGRSKNRRLKELEDEVAALRERINGAARSRDHLVAGHAAQTPAGDAHWQADGPGDTGVADAAGTDQADAASGIRYTLPMLASVAQPAADWGNAQLVHGNPKSDADGSALDTALRSDVDGHASVEETPQWLLAVRDWLLGGNVVAKLGLVILFIGVTFLLKYVAATVHTPIEVRLAGVVVADLALLAWGWRTRATRRAIGLPVQGTAIAILMLVVFGAYQRYALLPPTFAFALLVALTAFTCLLAVLQNAPWLAAFGITGGFACPILISTGSANHIGLFSYYALLNSGLFALSVKRAWRPLNLLGLGFTFVVGASWGGLRYTPEHYLSAQGFLILFFLFYVAIAVAFARQQQARLKHYVDATLVLGTPLLAFGLQVALVRDKPFGLALSALAIGGFYLTLALVLWRRGGERWRVLVETFAALGAVFGTLAIPFAVDGRWTSGAWALEGAGFVWLGLRLGQRATWMFGLLLQAGAWASFIGAAGGLDPETARTSNLWLGFLLLAASAFIMARQFRQHAGDAQPGLARIANLSIGIAAIWLLAGTWAEAMVRTSGSALANWLVGGALLTAALLQLTSRRMAWPQATWLALGAQLAGATGLLWVVNKEWLSLYTFSSSIDSPPLLGIMMVAVAAIATSRMLDRMCADPVGKPIAAAMLAWGGAWWFLGGLTIAAFRLEPWAPESLGSAAGRWCALYAGGVAASAAVCTFLSKRMAWPRLRRLDAASWLVLAAYTLITLADMYSQRSMPAPGVWLGWACLLASTEYALWYREIATAPVTVALVRAIHVLRTAGPLLALWQASVMVVDRWLDPSLYIYERGHQDSWATRSTWGSYLATWALMAALAWLLKRSRQARWPTAPLEHWYRASALPTAALLVLALAMAWNLGQDGTMAPLPYLPVFNPLDLTTGFALVLWASTARLHGPAAPLGLILQVRLRAVTLGVAYVCFNLMLLRSAAHYLGIAYWLDDLAASQAVQAMLSLVWSASALALMRVAAQRALRGTWGVGAVLVGIVVLKLLTVDMANTGSIARVVSFVGVGLLLVLIGYLAPYPKHSTPAGPPAGKP